MTNEISKDDPHFGGYGWVQRSGGSITAQERRRLIGAILRSQAEATLGRLQLALGRRPDTTAIPTPPDSALARDAEEAARQQSAGLLGHSQRTWAFGRALAQFDRAAGLDEELFYTSCLLHDVGLMAPVAGEDFTIRSAATATSIAAPHCSSEEILTIQDAIVAHVNPGASVETDGIHGFYVQAGAACDLGGFRLQQLSADYVNDVVARHPRHGLNDDIGPRLKAEARAVPDGRYALLDKVGFELVIRFAPLPG